MKAMKLAIFQHSAGEPPGSLTIWLEKNSQQKNLQHKIFRVDQFQFPLSVEEFDMLIVLGGIPNVFETKEYPWLLQEKKWIHYFLGMNKPILGICLGGQLLAEALGGQVKKHEIFEQGWADVQLDNSTSLFPVRTSVLNAFHWHECQFTLPPGAQRLAWNAVTKNQAFVYNQKWVGFQFHPEATLPWIKEHCSGHDIADYQQPMQKWFFQFLDNYFKAIQELK